MVRNKRQRISKGQSKNDNPEKLATYREEKKQNKHNTWWTPLYASKHNNVDKTCALLQTTGGKEHRFYAEIVTREKFEDTKGVIRIRKSKKNTF